MSAARSANAGPGGYALVFTLGLILGLGDAWIMYKMGAVVYARIQGKPESTQDWYAWVIYLAALSSAVFLFLGMDWLSPVILLSMR